MSNEKLAICSWSDVKDSVFDIDPELASLLDETKDAHRHPLILAKYPFASHIIHHGDFFIPSQVGTINRFSDNKHDTQITGLLDYYWGSIPMGLVLSGSVESYWKSVNQIIPMGVLGQGETFALRTVFDREGWCNFHKAWNLTSGARLLFSIPSLKDTAKFKKLNKSLQTRVSTPKSFTDHWQIFKHTYPKVGDNQEWNTTLLIFSKGWVDGIVNQRYPHLYNYLLKRIWVKQEFNRNRRIFDHIWRDFSSAAVKEGFKLKQQIYDHVKNLVLIGVGVEFAFRPDFSRQIAPLDSLASMLLDDYGLTYQPTFMCTDKLSWSNSGMLYDSLQMPTYQASASRSNNSGLDDMRESLHLSEFFLEQITLKKLPMLDNTRFMRLPDEVKYTYFHTDKDYSKRIHNVEKMFAEDERFTMGEYFSDLEPCYSSKFFKGCVRIAKL